MSKELKQVLIPGPLIIGAGPSGLAVAACLKKRGVPSLILEKENCMASLWNLKTYDRLRLHLPKKFCELPYMKFPSEFPAYPTKQQFISYLEDYAKSFSIEPMFGQEVRWTKYDRSMRLWQVEAKESKFLCRWLIVATGENAEPVVPEIAGISNFGGRLLHTSIYKNGADFKGSKVLVVGCGNSGMEVSLDLCDSGAQVSLVVRDKVPPLVSPFFFLSFPFLFPSMFCFLVCVHNHMKFLFLWISNQTQTPKPQKKGRDVFLFYFIFAKFLVSASQQNFSSSTVDAYIIWLHKTNFFFSSCQNCKRSFPVRDF